jgi:hypothetical protein
MSVLAHGLALRAPDLDRAATLAVMACICAPLGGAWLGVVLPALGRQLDPTRWPVRVSTRATSLLVVALAPFLPIGTALAATAATGPGDVTSAASAITEMVFVAVVCAAGAAWIAAWPRPGRRRPFNVGAHLAWVLALLFLSLWRAPTARVVQVGLGVVAMCGATAALERGRRTLPTATALEGT